MRRVSLFASICLVGCATDVGSGAASSGPPKRDEAVGVATSAIVVREHTKLLGPEEDLNAFGGVMALEGSTALIADPWAAQYAGKVHVFTRDAGAWSLTQTLVPTVPRQNAFFGASIGLAGDEALIGAPSDGPKGTVYLWRRSTNAWAQAEELVPADTNTGAAFGGAIAVAGDLAIIGAPGDDTVASSAGAAYVYARTGGAWAASAKLLPSDGVENLGFGQHVAVDGETIVVGAPGLGSTVAHLPGRAYVFQKVDGAWVEQRLAIDGGFDDDAAGRVVAAFADHVFVGVPANGDAEPTSHSGEVRVFARQGAAFVPAATLAAPDASLDDAFGHALASVGDRLVVGAPGADGTATDAGAVYLFERGDAGWGSPTALATEDQRNDLGFGVTVVATATTMIVGVRDVFFDVAYAFAFLGPTCAASGDCETGSCVDGVCCESACEGACATCAAPGREGLCVAEPASTPDPACGVYVCGEGGACKRACGSTADCADGHACNAEGVCVPAPKSSDDGPSDGDDGGGTDGAGDDGGCAVGVAPSSVEIGWLVLGATLVFARRRGLRAP